MARRPAQVPTAQCAHEDRRRADGVHARLGRQPRDGRAAGAAGRRRRRRAGGAARIFLRHGPARHRQAGAGRSPRGRPDPGLPGRHGARVRRLAGGWHAAREVRRAGPGAQPLLRLRARRHRGGALRQGPPLRLRQRPRELRRRPHAAGRPARLCARNPQTSGRAALAAAANGKRLRRRPSCAGYAWFIPVWEWDSALRAGHWSACFPHSV